MNRILPVLLSTFTALIPVANEDPSAKKWWKETVFYEIYMPSYADSNGDGYGDFKGMTAKLDYLQSLGIKGIWLTPFLQSPKVDNGYDVASYYEIDPAYGTMEDFQTYLAVAHQKGIRVIMDMVLNHTSTESEWFRQARRSVSNPYRDYYVWKDKPNNWESFFGGSAWQLDTLTNQYYYHKFDKRMADLNWSNPKVIDEISRVLRYWLDLGIDGFRLDVINFLTTDGITKDNPTRNGMQEHLHDINQPGVKDAIKKIRSIVNQYKDRFIVGEIGSDQIDILKQYQSAELLDVVFNFNFGSIAKFSAQKVFDELQTMERTMRGFPTLFFGSHDMPRMMDRLAAGDTRRAEALAALMLTAKGIPFIYFGEEIGMHNILAASPDEIADIQGRTHYELALESGKDSVEALRQANEKNRDKSRSPMQWNSKAFAGFSTARSWIKINPDHKYLNVQAMEKNKNSILNTYRQLLQLRNSEKVLQYGRYEQLAYIDDRIIFTRAHLTDKITVVINFGRPQKIPVPRNGKILMGKASLASNSFVIYRN